MNILLLCDKSEPALFPLSGELPVAQLPLAGKIVAEYALESLYAKTGAQQAMLYGGPYTRQLHKQLGAGERWGMDLGYLAQLPATPALPLLVLPCDRISGFDLPGFLRVCREHPHDSLTAMAGDTPLAYWIATLDDWREVVGGAMQVRGKQMDWPGAEVAVIDTLRAFYDASLDLLRGRFPGQHLAPDQQGLALIRGSRARVSQHARLGGRVYVGAASQLADAVATSGDCVVGPDVLVDGGATLENCVILPHTYVGQRVAIRNALVSGPLLWRMDTGAAMRIEQRFLLSRLPLAGESGGWWSRWLGRGSATTVQQQQGAMAFGNA